MIFRRLFNYDYLFFNAQSGYIIDTRNIYTTKDAGVTRTPVVTVKSGGNLVRIYFKDEQHGWAVNEANVIYRYVQ